VVAVSVDGAALIRTTGERCDRRGAVRASRRHVAVASPPGAARVRAPGRFAHGERGGFRRPPGRGIASIVPAARALERPSGGPNPSTPRPTLHAPLVREGSRTGGADLCLARRQEAIFPEPSQRICGHGSVDRSAPRPLASVQASCRKSRSFGARTAAPRHVYRRLAGSSVVMRTRKRRDRWIGATRNWASFDLRMQDKGRTLF
jgi:hypothetical protein